MFYALCDHIVVEMQILVHDSWESWEYYPSTTEAWKLMNAVSLLWKLLKVSLEGKLEEELPN